MAMAASATAMKSPMAMAKSPAPQLQLGGYIKPVEPGVDVPGFTCKEQGQWEGDFFFISL